MAFYLPESQDEPGAAQLAGTLLGFPAVFWQPASAHIAVPAIRITIISRSRVMSNILAAP